MSQTPFSPNPTLAPASPPSFFSESPARLSPPPSPAAPVVLSSSTGAVRRMRSVLELRLGPLALPAPASGAAAFAALGAAQHLDIFGLEIPRAHDGIVVLSDDTPLDLDLSALMC